MTAREQRIVDLVTKCESVWNIAGDLGVSTNAVRLILSRLGVSAVVVPRGHITIREAARRFGASRHELYRGIARGDLRHVVSGSRYYVTMEWVQIWVNNAPYRVWTREHMRGVVQRLFARKSS